MTAGRRSRAPWACARHGAVCAACRPSSRNVCRSPDPRCLRCPHEDHLRSGPRRRARHGKVVGGDDRDRSPRRLAPASAGAVSLGPATSGADRGFAHDTAPLSMACSRWCLTCVSMRRIRSWKSSGCSRNRCCSCSPPQRRIRVVKEEMIVRVVELPDVSRAHVALEGARGRAIRIMSVSGWPANTPRRRVSSRPAPASPPAGRTAPLALRQV